MEENKNQDIVLGTITDEYLKSLDEELDIYEENDSDFDELQDIDE